MVWIKITTLRQTREISRARGETGDIDEFNPSFPVSPNLVQAVLRTGECRDTGRHNPREPPVRVRMLALGIEDGRVVLVDEATGEEDWAVHAHPHSGRIMVAMSPDFRFVASVGLFDQSWKLWNAASGVVLRKGAEHDGTGDCICRTVRQGLRILLEGCPIEGHLGGIRDVAFSPCGEWIATAGLDGAVILWDALSGKQKRRMQGDAEGASFGAAWSVCFSADGAWLACGSAVGSIQVWTVGTGALHRTIPLAPKKNSLVSVLFAPTESRDLLAWEEDYRIGWWDIDSGEKKRSIAGGAFAAFSRDGRTIATGSATKGSDVELVDVESGAVRLTLAGEEASVCSGTFCGRGRSGGKNGSMLASATYDGSCKLWDTKFGVLRRTIQLGNAVQSLVWAPDWAREEQEGTAAAVGSPRGLRKGILRLVCLG